MIDKEEVFPVKDEWVGRAPIDRVFMNWRLWKWAAIIALGAVLAIALGVYLSMKFQDWGFLGRFGALITILGSYLLGRPMWRHRYKPHYVTATILRNGHLAPEQLAENIMQRTDIWFFYIGSFFAAVGSIIWGFADLVNCVYSSTDHAFPCAIPILQQWLK